MFNGFHRCGVDSLLKMNSASSFACTRMKDLGLSVILCALSIKH